MAGRSASTAHASTETGTEMKFSVFVPANPSARPLPSLTFLAGLTCTEETFMIKAGALRHAAELGLVLVAPDTSPRGLGLPGEEDSWDFGTGAGFYVDAEAEPWRTNYRMYSYVTRELPALIEANFPVDAARRGVFGHSMGGHGALVVALKNPQAYRSVSAFAPICNPVAVPWGEKAFGNYLGPDRARWAAWDASELMRAGRFPASDSRRPGAEGSVPRGAAPARARSKRRPSVQGRRWSCGDTRATTTPTGSSRVSSRTISNGMPPGSPGDVRPRD